MFAFGFTIPCPPTAVDCTVYTSHWALRQILGLQLQTGRIHLGRNSTTTSLSWSHNTSSLTLFIPRQLESAPRGPRRPSEHHLEKSEIFSPSGIMDTFFMHFPTGSPDVSCPGWSWKIREKICQPIGKKEAQLVSFYIWHFQFVPFKRHGRCCWNI